MSGVRYLLVGVGGPTSSGKTTLVKHIANIIGGGVRSTDANASTIPPLAPMIVHQDDFAPPSEEIPFNAEHGMQDWDTPKGSIDYERFLSTLQHVRRTGEMPEGFSSHDAANKQPPVEVPEDLVRSWRARLTPLLELKSKTGASGRTDGDPTRVRIVLADGFLLYYSARVRAEMDVRLFLRIRKDLLRERREQRGGYNTAEGQLWTDPPGYFDKLLWPAYELAHRQSFLDGDVERGALVPAVSDSEAGSEEEDGGPVRGLVLLEAQMPDDAPRPMAELVQRSCEEIERALLALRSEG